MTYLLSKRIIVFFLAIFLGFVFEGAISLKFFPKRNDRIINSEVLLLYQKIDDLEQQLKKEKTQDKSISANIIFGGGYLFSDFIILDKGFLDGVEKDDFVIYKSSIVVAKIKEVFSGYSKAALFSRFGEKTILRSGSGKSVLFEVEGRGGREILASLPKGSGVNTGESAYLAENPRFLVGLVEKAQKKEGRDFEELSIVVPFSLRSIAEVNIIKNNVKE